MVLFKLYTIFYVIRCNRVLTLNPSLEPYRRCYFGSLARVGSVSLHPSPNLVQRVAQNRVGVFWDLDNKPPKPFPPYEAAIRLKNALTEFGVVRYMVAYANQHAFSYVPPEVRAQRRERKALGKKGVVTPNEPYVCRVCGRRFYTNERFINHFKQIHETEQMKRLRQIESARGSRRVKLVAKYSIKMEKYKNAARDILTPKVRYGLADESERAGFWVRTMSDKTQVADNAMRNHMVEMMDKRQVECVVLVSDDSDFVQVLKEARLRCLRTVVVGDSNEGVLKRTADAAFSWQETLMGKAKKEAMSFVGRLKDHNVLKRLEWTYNQETERRGYCSDSDVDGETEDSDISNFFSDEDDNLLRKEEEGPWWELKSNNVVASS